MAIEQKVDQEEMEVDLEVEVGQDMEVERVAEPAPPEADGPRVTEESNHPEESKDPEENWMQLERDLDDGDKELKDGLPLDWIARRLNTWGYEQLPKGSIAAGLVDDEVRTQKYALRLEKTRKARELKYGPYHPLVISTLLRSEKIADLREGLRRWKRMQISVGAFQEDHLRYLVRELKVAKNMLKRFDAFPILKIQELEEQLSGRIGILGIRHEEVFSILKEQFEYISQLVWSDRQEIIHWISREREQRYEQNKRSLTLLVSFLVDVAAEFEQDFEEKLSLLGRALEIQKSDPHADSEITIAILERTASAYAHLGKIGAQIKCLRDALEICYERLHDRLGVAVRLRWKLVHIFRNTKDLSSLREMLESLANLESVRSEKSGASAIIFYCLALVQRDLGNWIEAHKAARQVCNGLNGLNLNPELQRLLEGCKAFVKQCDDGLTEEVKSSPLEEQEQRLKESELEQALLNNSWAEEAESLKEKLNQEEGPRQQLKLLDAVIATRQENYGMSHPLVVSAFLQKVIIEMPSSRSEQLSRIKRFTEALQKWHGFKQGVWSIPAQHQDFVAKIEADITAGYASLYLDLQHLLPAVNLEVNDDTQLETDLLQAFTLELVKVVQSFYPPTEFIYSHLESCLKKPPVSFAHQKEFCRGLILLSQIKICQQLTQLEKLPERQLILIHVLGKLVFPVNILCMYQDCWPPLKELREECIAIRNNISSIAPNRVQPSQESVDDFFNSLPLLWEPLAEKDAKVASTKEFRAKSRATDMGYGGEDDSLLQQAMVASLVGDKRKATGEGEGASPRKHPTPPASPPPLSLSPTAELATVATLQQLHGSVMAQPAGPPILQGMQWVGSIISDLFKETTWENSHERAGIVINTIDALLEGDQELATGIFQSGQDPKQLDLRMVRSNIIFGDTCNAVKNYLQDSVRKSAFLEVFDCLKSRLLADPEEFCKEFGQSSSSGNMAPPVVIPTASSSSRSSAAELPSLSIISALRQHGFPGFRHQSQSVEASSLQQSMLKADLEALILKVFSCIGSAANGREEECFGLVLSIMPTILSAGGEEGLDLEGLASVCGFNESEHEEVFHKLAMAFLDIQEFGNAHGNTEDNSHALEIFNLVQDNLEKDKQALIQKHLSPHFRSVGPSPF